MQKDYSGAALYAAIAALAAAQMVQTWNAASVIGVLLAGALAFKAKLSPSEVPDHAQTSP